jgi:hypothetical protein
MVQAQKRLVTVAKAQRIPESQLYDAVVNIGKDLLNVVDPNRGSNPQLTVHDLMNVINNSDGVPDQKLATVLKNVDSLRGADRKLLPGIPTKPGPPGDGSSRYLANLASAPNLGVPFESAAAVFLRDSVGEQVVGMGARATMADGTIFEGDINTITKFSQPGKPMLGLWDAKNANGQSSLTADKVTRAKNAVLQGAPVQLGSQTYITGEAGFAIEAGGSVSADVQLVIDAANVELTQAGFPPIRVVTGIPF